MALKLPKPTNAFIGASWSALLIGSFIYFIGLWNADVGLGEKGYYVVLMLFGLYSVVSLQKSVRDRQEDIPTSDLYHGISWTAVLLSLLLMLIGLWNATFTLAEKGFYGITFAMSLFAAVTVQKNIRDIKVIDRIEGNDPNNKTSKPWFKSDLLKSSSNVNTDNPD